MLVRAWAERRNVKRPDNGTLSSYAWVCAVIFFLQFRHQLPLLQAPPLLQQGAAQWVGGHNTAFCDPFDARQCAPARLRELLQAEETWARDWPVGTLLLNFFAFLNGRAGLGSAQLGGAERPGLLFSMRTHCLSVRTGQLLKKQQRWGNGGGDGGTAPSPSPPWRVSIEDPFERDHDLGRVGSRCW